MLIIKDIYNLQTYLKAYRNKGYSIGYVPTMGALHEGHGSLIEKSHNDNHKTIISIFINEKQFNSSEDYKNYPRNRGRDYEFCDQKKVDLVFEPEHDQIYSQKDNLLENKFYKDILCDISRPNHFNGVITVLNKFFSIIKSDVVYFGEKDYQQVKIVQSFIEQRFPELRLKVVPTIRSPEGIALSSRNEKLSKKQFDELISFNSKVREFMNDLEPNLEIYEANIKAKKFINLTRKFDYFEFRNSKDLSFKGKISGSRLFYAIYVGKVRLIDNFNFKEN